MFENKILHVSPKEAEIKIKELNGFPNVHVAVVEGRKAKTWNAYLKQIERLYKFPTTGDNFDGYADWMQDLSWLEKDSFALFILDYEEFMCLEEKNKQIVMSIFTEQILPWWQHDVELYCVGGKPKEFNVYLVNNR